MASLTKTITEIVEAKPPKLEPLQPPEELEAAMLDRHLYEQLEAKLFEDKLLTLEGLKAHQTIIRHC